MSFDIWGFDTFTSRLLREDSFVLWGLGELRVLPRLLIFLFLPRLNGKTFLLPRFTRRIGDIIIIPITVVTSWPELKVKVGYTF